MKKTLFLLPLLATLLFPSCQTKEWEKLIDQTNADDWRKTGNPEGWSIHGDTLVIKDTGTLLYTGPVAGHQFRNFILETEVRADSGTTAGILFHVSPGQFPAQKGYEVRISNHPAQDGIRMMSGSLAGIRNLCKPTVEDGVWFTLRISVEGKTVRTWINDHLLVDYTEPTAPFRTPENDGCRLGSGTFALINNTEGGSVAFRNLRVKPLRNDLATPGTPLEDSALSARLIRMNAQGIPLADLHVHLKEGLTVEQALTHARKYGFTYGIAFNGGLKMYIETDDSLGKFLDSYQKPPQTWLAMQAEGREWMDIFSEKNIRRFDYVFTDAMTWTNDKGKRMRLWIPEETEIGDPENFMDQLVDRIVRIVNNEPIDIYVNATYLPDAIAPRYDELWTTERMDRVIKALKENGVAMEISARFKIPSATFIRRAKAAGVKFTFGTNNTGPDDLGSLEYCMDMVEQCGLTPTDFWFPDL